MLVRGPEILNWSGEVMKKLFLILVLMFIAGPASAYFTWGIGEQDCNIFVSEKTEFEFARDQRTHLAHLNWIKGFITGINWSRDSDIAKDLSIETVDKWIYDYCREHLGDSIAEASAALVVHLEKEGSDATKAKP